MENVRDFNWGLYAKVEKWFLRVIEDFKENTVLRGIDSKLPESTSSRLLDWVDHIILPESKQTVHELEGMGFQREGNNSTEAYEHPGAMLPHVVIAGGSSDLKAGVAIRVETIADFLQVNGFHADIEGSPFSPFRRALAHLEKGAALYAVERRGAKGFEPTAPGDDFLHHYFKAVEMCKNVPRGMDDEEAALSEITKWIRETTSALGGDLTAYILCRCERDYWISRNYAARIQKNRQDAIGLGWANQDHHTFRSSRRHFPKLVALFSELGFHKRERYYAGKEAGWGAQIMENATAGLVVFLDVDLYPEEIEIDFTTSPLEDREEMGTVGLWCALHGDSILKGGMHHLAAKFIFHRHIKDMARYGVKYMAPFSDFSYFKQAFSVAENWKIDVARVKNLLDRNIITTKQSDTFMSRGVIGSHLENIERREGYKGFNKKNVSTIIKATDPRKYLDSCNRTSR